VEIAFAAPTREWIGQRVRPTVNFFLHAIGENTDLRQTSFQATRVNGRAERKLPPRRIDLHFMVSALATEAEDEHRLLWRVLITLIQHSEIPQELLPEEVRQLGLPLTARTAQPGEYANLVEIWGGLGVEPHPAFSYTLTVPVDVELTISSPLVLTRTVRFGRGLDGATEEEHTHIGGIVRTRDGAPVAGVRVAVVGSAAEPALTDVEGQFRLLNVRTGTVELRVIQADGAEQTAALSVPSDSYDIVLT
jgi:hypothetical protein